MELIQSVSKVMTLPDSMHLVCVSVKRVKWYSCIVHTSCRMEPSGRAQIVVRLIEVYRIWSRACLLGRGGVKIWPVLCV